MSIKEERDGLPVAKTEEGIAFARWMKALRATLKDQDDVDVKACNEALLELKLRPNDVHQDELLTNLSVMYANDEYIGTRLMPVVFTNGALSGTYYEYNKRDRFAYPDDSMADRTTPPEISQGRTKRNYSLQPRALVEYLDFLTVQNQSAPLNEMVDLQMNVLEGLEHNREKACADILCTAGNYGANTVALGAGDRWDSSGGGDPGGVVDAAMAECWIGRGPGRFVGFTSLAVHNVLKRHPKILDQFKASGQRPGFATREMIREYFELDEYLVGKSRKDTANEGQTASYGRVWSNVFGIVRVATSPSLRNAAFGYTLQDAPTNTDVFWQPEKSVKGSWMSRCARSDQQKIVAADTAYLITTPIG